MHSVTTTMSFRAAWRFGCAHLAGQGVRLIHRAKVGFDVFIIATGERIGSVYFPRSMRERGGVQRDAECAVARV